MVGEIVLNQALMDPKDESAADELQSLCKILIEAIPEDRKQQLAGKVIAYLASQTIQSIEKGDERPRITTKQIYIDLGGNPKQEPSAWLSPIWKEIENRHYPEIEPTLIEECRHVGLAHYPKLEKDSGKPATYRIGLAPLRACSDEQPSPDKPLPKQTIHYKRDLSLKLSWLGKLFFGTELRLTPFNRYGYLTWQLLFLLAFTLYELSIWVLLWHSQAPISGRELVLATMGIGIPVLAYWQFRESLRLFEDKILIAPEWTLAIKESGATIEINRSKNPDEASTILVQRYTSVCPLCGWMIKLDRGEPDFARRIVGRCVEHPREHVFSFDRMTKQGRLLRLDVAQCEEKAP